MRASYTYGTATETKDFELTVKDRAPYEIDTVTMKGGENVVYRPTDNSEIVSVSYTKNDTSAADATLYLAIYDDDGRLVSCEKSTADGTVAEFKQKITKDQTYKVFVWDNGMKPFSTSRAEDQKKSKKLLCS